MRTKLILSAFCLLTIAVVAGPIYQFNPTSRYVTNRGVAIFWGDELAFMNRTNYMIDAYAYPAGVPLEFTKSSNGTIAALTSTESNLVVSLTASNATFAATVARTNLLKSGSTSFDNLDAQSRALRFFALATLDQINTLRKASTNGLSIITTNQFLNALSNAIVADPR